MNIFCLILRFCSDILACKGRAYGKQSAPWPFVLLLICVLNMQAFAEQTSDFEIPDTLLISMGDSIVVNVYNEPDLAVRTRVDQTGMVNFPLVGALAVIGLSTNQLATELEKRYLDGFLVEPLVTVSIEKYRPFYIHGEVKNPGVYEFSQDLSINQAIAIAGGLTERASSSNWFIARGSEAEPIKATASTRVLPGDIITVKASFF